jgi:hypothetical protein
MGKQTKASATYQINALAALIFVLWSLGVLILPALGASADTTQRASSMLVRWEEWAYISLHGIIFAFTLYLIARLFSARNRSPMATKCWQAALYVYVLAVLIASLYLILGAAQLHV